jgi:hypothetical protein
MEPTEIIQGRPMGEADIAQVRKLVEEHPGWSRWRISVELATVWNWRSGTGQLKDMAARSLLLKMEHRGLLRLPAKRQATSPRGPLAKAFPSDDLFPTAPPETIEGVLKDLQPLSLEVVKVRMPSYGRFSGYLAEHHYLSFKGFVGESLGYLARDRQGRDLACMVFGAAAWKTMPRDKWIGWTPATRAKNLSLVTNNTRFLILPWVHVPHLASHLLGTICRRLSADWQSRHGHPIHLLETFVEKRRFKGTCYRAANWTCVGETKGRSRQDRYDQMVVPIKDIYVYPLTPGFREELCRVGS